MWCTDMHMEHRHEYRQGTHTQFFFNHAFIECILTTSIHSSTLPLPNGPSLSLPHLLSVCLSFFHLFVCLFRESVSLGNPSLSGICHIDLGGLELTDVHLLLPPQCYN